MTDLDPRLAPLAFLVGTWKGGGRGVYPTIEPFSYTEEVTMDDTGRPFLEYRQRTRDATTGEPLHTETGYWRPGRPGRVELLLVQPTGIAEVHEGTVAGSTIRVRSRLVGLTRTAKPVRAVERRLWVEGDELQYELHMEAVGQEHQIHLAATLRRT